MKTFSTLFAFFICFSINAQNPSLMWAKGFTGSSSQYGKSLDIDSSGSNVYSCGIFYAVTDFDPGAAVFSLTNLGTYDTYISKLDQNGAMVWARQFGGSGASVEPYALQVNAAGELLIAGNFSGTVDFDPGAGSYNMSSSGGSIDIFACKLDSSGNLLWARRIGGSSDDLCQKLTIDAAGDIYYTGYFSATVDFDPAAFTSYNLTSLGNEDVFVLKLTTNGDFIWAKQMGGSGYDGGYCVTSDGATGIFITGVFQSTNADFDPGTGTFNLSSNANSIDVFILKLDAGGSFAWAKQIGGTGADLGYSIVTDTAGNLYACGMFSASAVDFDPGAGSSLLTSNGLNDIYILKLDPSGNFQWVKQIGSNSYDYCLSLKQSGNGIIATGSFEAYSCDFDPGPAVNNFINPDSTKSDAYILKLDSSGNLVWAGQIGGDGNDEGADIVPDDYGNFYLTGHFSAGGNCDFDPGTGVYTITGQSSNEAFVCKFYESSVGINETKTEKAGLLAYPNPCTDVLYLKSEKKNNSFSLINAQGQMVKHVVTNDALIKMDMNSLPAGLYVLLSADGLQTKILKN